MLVVWRIVGALDAQVPATGKPDHEHGLADSWSLHRAHRAAPECGLKEPGQLLAPGRAGKDMDVAAESEHDLVGPFCQSGPAS